MRGKKYSYSNYLTAEYYKNLSFTKSDKEIAKVPTVIQEKRKTATIFHEIVVLGV